MAFDFSDMVEEARISARALIDFSEGLFNPTLRLGITGFARNLDDGCVEVLACGSDEAVAALERWLQNGPPLARVSAVEREPANIDPPARFSTS